jgi:antitoxin CcdA
MPLTACNNSATRKATNVSINTDLLRQAKDAGINLSKVSEDRPEPLLVEKKRQQWIDNNRDALEAYNRRVAARGVFSDGRREF